jgi:hypothetical protein
MIVPSFPTVALAPLLILTVWQNISKADEVFLPKIGFVLLLSIAFSPGYEYVGEKFLGLIQCVRALLLIWCLVIVGSILEVLDVIRDVSDSFREWAFRGSPFTIYDADYRDISLVGWPRPKLFSVEPSHVTKFFIVAVNSWLLVRVTWIKSAVVAGATLLMLIIMGSPMIIISAGITIAILLYDRQTSRRVRAWMVLTSLLAAVLFGIYYGESNYSKIAGRLTTINLSAPKSNQSIGSEEARIIAPYATLANTWLRWPLFGVGISGKEVLIESEDASRDNYTVLGNNALAEIGIYLGVIGGTWFIYLFLVQAHQTGVRRLGLLVVIGALFSQLMGGVESFRYWGFISILWGALAVADTRAHGDSLFAQQQTEED